MINKISKIKYILILVLSSLGLSAQVEFNYTYDRNGNRITRNAIHLKAVSGSSNSTSFDNNMISESNVDTVYFSISKGKMEINIFPNPTYESIKIKASTDNLKIKELRVYATDGKIVFKQQNLVGDQIVDFTNYSKGTYILWLNLDGNIRREVVIKE